MLEVAKQVVVYNQEEKKESAIIFMLPVSNINGAYNYNPLIISMYYMSLNRDEINLL